MKCLVVDDDYFGREMLAAFLSPYASHIDMAGNGAEAIEYFARAVLEGKPYQLVCLDIMMPVMDGQEAVKRIRRIEREADVPKGEAAIVTMISSLSSIHDIQEAIWDGDCDDYMVKPVSQADIVGLLKKHRLIDSPEEQ